VFKQDLFDIWCVEPTKKSNAKYKPFPMPDDYIPFSCWDLWVAIGPPAGDACNLILKVEFIAPPSASFLTSNGASAEQIPAAMLALSAGVASGRFLSRKAMSPLPGPSPNPQGSPTTSIQGERLDRDRMNDKITQLKWLSVSEFCDDDQKRAYRRQIHDLMVANCDSSSSPLATLRPSAELTLTPASVSSKEGAVQTAVVSGARLNALESTRLATIVLDKHVASALVFSPVRGFQLDDEEQKCPEKFDLAMSFVDYKKWLTFTHNLQSNCVPADGACLFESTIRCIKELVSHPEGASYRPLPILALLCPDWSTITASSFRKCILSIMQPFKLSPFTALEPFYYANLNEIILDEGDPSRPHSGIMDHKFRDDGNPPLQYSTAEEYFDLMASDSAYGNLSVLLAICICCDIQVHVWIWGRDLPEVYGAPTSTHYISFIKQNRLDHYDGLTWFDKKHRDYDASKRGKIIADEILSRALVEAITTAPPRANAAETASPILSPAAEEEVQDLAASPPSSLDESDPVFLVSHSEAAGWDQAVAQATVATAANAPLTLLAAEDALPAIVNSTASTATPTNLHHCSLSPRPFDVAKNLDKELNLREKIYKKWHKAKQSFDTIKWDRDIMRQESGTVAGKGIFAKTTIPRGTCVALYWGNLVDGDTGLIQVLAFAHTHALAHYCFTTSSFSSSPFSAHARQRRNSLRPTPTFSENIPKVTESSSAEMASIWPLTEVTILVPLMILMRTGETYCGIVIVLNL
jgi:hypothetical protein